MGPGCRAPHLWLDGGRSTIDLFDRDLVVLTAQPGAAWRDAAAASRDLGVPVGSHVVTNPEWPGRYGVTQAGAVLVRPDGHVAWRSRTAPAGDDAQLFAALRTATGGVAPPHLDGERASPAGSASGVVRVSRS